jgi:hypothetical protein
MVMPLRSGNIAGIFFLKHVTHLDGICVTGLVFLSPDSHFKKIIRSNDFVSRSLHESFAEIAFDSGEDVARFSLCPHSSASYEGF